MSLQKAEELVALNQQQRVPTNHRRPPKNVGKKSSTLLKSKDYALRVPPPPKVPCCFILWGMLSFIATVFLFAAFYLPYWIHGTYHDAFDVSFNSFSRCNYKHLDLADGSSIIMPECSNYRADSDLLSMYWKVICHSVRISMCRIIIIFYHSNRLLHPCLSLQFYSVFWSIFSFCFRVACPIPSTRPVSNGCFLFKYFHVSHSIRANFWIKLTLFACTHSVGLIISGLIVFPLGWTSVEVKDVCQISSDVLYDLGKLCLNEGRVLVC